MPKGSTQIAIRAKNYNLFKWEIVLRKKDTIKVSCHFENFTISKIIFDA